MIYIFYCEHLGQRMAIAVGLKNVRGLSRLSRYLWISIAGTNNRQIPGFKLPEGWLQD